MIRTNIVLKRNNFYVCIDELFTQGITGIYGHSGSGKTSLLHTIAGLETPDQGYIKIGDKTVFDSSAKINVPVHKRNIGYVFQEGRLFPHLNIEKNLNFGKHYSKNKLNFKDIVKLLEIGTLLKKKPHAISGGERQRVALGRALLSSPDILLLDEPFSAVDVNLREQIIPYLYKIHKTTDIPMLVVSHDMPDILKLTTKVCFIHKGQCLAHDDYHKLYTNKSIHQNYKKNTLLNIIELQVFASLSSKGISILHYPHSHIDIKVFCEQMQTQYAVDDKVKIFIKPDDIALSLTRLEDITIQNQLQGTISEIITRGKRSMCIVDVGFPLMVDITEASLVRLGLKNGSPVWCLFKSLSIDVVS